MTARGHSTGDQLSGRANRHASENISARQFPILHQIQELQKGLDALNERISELEEEGHHGHAMDVLKANALDFACQIDELRSLSIDTR
jgi:hypothetical protein